MEFLAVILVAAAVFGVCFLVDKAFTKLFRSRAQHRSGLEVRVSKHYGSVGLILTVLGVAAIFAGVPGILLLIIGGCVMILMGAGMILYYMSMGIYYDEESFLYAPFLGKNREYRFGQIRTQQLYLNGRGIILELTMDDGKTVQLHSGMKDIYKFLDKAFAAWLRQTDRHQEDCDFYDPDNHCWFPRAEE